MLTLDIQGRSLAFQHSGRGHPIILVHGFPLDHRIWEPVIPHLERDYELIMPDLQGFGSSANGDRRSNLADMAEDLICLLDHLGIAKAIFAGHSMGGYICLAAARDHPDRLSGVVLIASKAGADSADKKIDRVREANFISNNGISDLVNSMAEKLTSNRALQDRLKGIMGAQSPAAVAGALIAMAERENTTQMLKGLNVPVMILHGIDDRLLPIEVARELNQELRHNQLFELPGVGHMPMMEAPMETAQALRSFHNLQVDV
jgi:3-oxoadipate enol-lactonase